MLFLLSAPNSHANYFMSGNDLLDYCDSRSPTKLSLCNGYIMGVADTIPWINTALGKFGQKGACIPRNTNITSEQLRDIVVFYLRRNAKRRHETAEMLVFFPIQEAWERC
jgi:hypothetical protein